MTRKETLHTAETCVCGQREQDYGSPEDNFETIALLWGVYLIAAHPELTKVMAINHITPEDVAIMMNQLKVARIASGRPKADNYVDACGYMACAAEIATRRIRTSNVPSEPKGEYRLGDNSLDPIHQRMIEDSQVEAEQRETHEELVERAKALRKEFCERMNRCCDACPICMTKNHYGIPCKEFAAQHPQLALDLMTNN